MPSRPARTESALAFALVVVAGLGCAGGNYKEVRYRYERVGAAPPPEPRAVGPIVPDGQGRVELGGMTASAHGRDDTPSNVLNPLLLQLRASLGVSDHVELGVGALYAPSIDGPALRTGLPTERLRSRWVGGAAFQARGYIANRSAAYLAWQADLAFLVLPYHELNTVSENGGPWTVRKDRADGLLFVSLQTGLHVGFRPAPGISLGPGFLVQTYPAFESSETTELCMDTCDEEVPGVTRTAFLGSPFVWMSGQVGSVVLTVSGSYYAVSSHQIHKAMPWSAGVSVGYQW